MSRSWSTVVTSPRPFFLCRPLGCPCNASECLVYKNFPRHWLFVCLFVSYGTRSTTTHYMSFCYVSFPSSPRVRVPHLSSLTIKFTSPTSFGGDCSIVKLTSGFPLLPHSGHQSTLLPLPFHNICLLFRPRFRASVSLPRSYRPRATHFPLISLSPNALTLSLVSPGTPGTLSDS